MFVRNLAMAVGRLDFWNVYAELTPYELAVHMAAQSIDPVGEERADMRAAVNTLSLLQAQSAKPLGEEQVRSIIGSLTGYLRRDEESAKDISVEESARLGKAAFARIGK